MLVANIENTKESIRKEIRQRLQAMSEAEKEAASRRISMRIARFADLHPEIKTIATFAPMELEPDLMPLHTILPKHRFIYPLSEPDGSLEFYHVANPGTLFPGEFGVLEPSREYHNMVPPEEIDLFLCPACAYSADGRRLNKGGGYYDRYLMRCPQKAQKAGVLFQCQLSEDIPEEKCDPTVDRLFIG